MSNAHSAPWPDRLTKNTFLTAHVTHSWGTEQWFRLHQAGDRLQWQCAQASADGWRIADLGEPTASIVDAIKLNRVNMSFGKGSIVEIATRPECIQQVLHGLIPPRFIEEDGAGWDEGTRQAWRSIADELPFELPHANVWATINDARVLMVKANSNSKYPVLFDLDEANFAGLTVIAESSWFSESGGAPISWDGGARLSRLYPGVLWSEAWGDTRQEAEALDAYGPIEMGEAAAEMVLADELQFAAAWALEPFDTGSLLDPTEELEWFALREEVTMAVTFDLEPGEQLPACRARLLKDPTYAAIAEALADPTSTRGLALHSRLEEVRASGVIGGVLGYALGDLTGLPA